MLFTKPRLRPENMNLDGSYNSRTPEFHRMVENWTWDVTYGDVEPMLAIESGPVTGVIVPATKGPQEEGVEPVTPKVMAGRRQPAIELGKRSKKGIKTP